MGDTVAFNGRRMSRSGRKRNSKWDLKEVPQFPPQSVHGDGCPRESSFSYHCKQSQPGWHASKVAGLKDQNWGSQKNDSINEDCTIAWKGDEDYSMRMSPGLDEWRQQRRTPSPKHGWSRSCRSRSRSPGPGFKQESSLSDRRSRLGVPYQGCRDFAVGRCRRGERCQFLHNCNLHYEDRRHIEGSLIDRQDSRPTRCGASKYYTLHDSRDYTMKNERSVVYCNNYLKGKCWKGESCKYAHHSASDGNEEFREGRKDRRDRDTSSKHVFDRESHRNGAVTCKFYAVGKCRNGKSCRFFHQDQTYPSVDGRSRDDRWRMDHNLDNVEQLTRHPNSSKSNTFLDSTNCAEVENGRVVGPAILESIQPMDDKWDCRLDNEKELQVGPTNNAKAVESNKSELFQCGAENSGPELGVSKSMDTARWLGEMEKSSPWNCRARSQDNVVMPNHVTQNSNSLNFSKIGPESGVSKSMDAERWLGVMEKSSPWNCRARSLDNVVMGEPDYVTQNSNSLNFSKTGPESGVSKSIDTERWLGEMEKFSSWNCQARSPNNVVKGEPDNVTQNSNSLNFSKTGPESGVSKSMDTERWLGEMEKSSPWNCRARSPNNVMKGEPDNVIQNSNSLNFSKTGPGLGVSKSVDTESWLGEMEKSSPWNCRARSPNNVVKEEPDYVTQNSNSLNFRETYVPTHEQVVTPEDSSQIQYTSASIQPMIYEKSFSEHNPSSRKDNALSFPSGDRNAIGHSSSLCFNLNFSADVLPCNNFNDKSLSVQPLPTLDVVGQGQLALLPSLKRGENSENSRNSVQLVEEESMKPDNAADSNTSQVTPGILPAENTASSEQLAQLTNLSVSLAQLLGSGEQLPQLYTALNSTCVTEKLAAPPNSVSLVAQVSAASIHPNPVIGSQKRGELNGGNSSKTGILKDSNQAKPVADYEVSGSNVMEAKESKNAEEEVAPENDLLSNLDGNGKVDENKKSKVAKGIRTFKFALAEFVKELLKPSWKDGQINKDVYKIIVKKVVDKVTVTMQASRIPQNQEKIKQYLSLSKPKLTKLIQAYVERHQKS